MRGPFLGRSSENWTVSSFPHSQQVGHGIRSDLKQVSVSWLHTWQVEETQHMAWFSDASSLLLTRLQMGVSGTKAARKG